MIFLKIITIIISPFLLLGACWLGGKLGMKAARRNKKTGIKTPEFRRKTPPPKLFFLSSDGNKTPFDDKIAEAERMLNGEGRPYLPQLYKIEGVDLAEPEEWPKENLADACAACGNGLVFLKTSYGYYDDKKYYRFVCCKCGLSSSPCEDIAEAARKWRVENERKKYFKR